jgi:hypothetical protein
MEGIIEIIIARKSKVEKSSPREPRPDGGLRSQHIQNHLPPPGVSFLGIGLGIPSPKTCSDSLRLLRQTGCFPAALRPARLEAVVRPVGVGP